MTIDDQELRDYLRTIEHFEHLRDGWVYKGVHNFLLCEARVWSPVAGILQRGTPKNCFDNAYRLAKRRGWRYVEGYATSIVPVHHAWVVDDADRVVEKTWPTLGVAYFGVVLSLERVLLARLAGCASVLANYHDQFRIYRELFGGDDDDADVEAYPAQSRARGRRAASA